MKRKQEESKEIRHHLLIESHSMRIANEMGTVPSGLPNKPSCFIVQNEKKCDWEENCGYWHQPECILHKKGQCNKGNKCLFQHFGKDKKADGKKKTRKGAIPIAMTPHNDAGCDEGDPWQSALQGETNDKGSRYFKYQRKKGQRLQERDKDRTRGVICPTQPNEQNPNAIMFAQKRL